MIAAWVTLLWLAVIAAKLGWLQLVRYSEYKQRAARQQQRTIDLSPKRGVIYDRNGNALAMTVDVDSVFAVPSEIPDKANTAAILAKVLHLDAKELLNKFENSQHFVWVARKIDNDTAARVRGLNLQGVAFQKESKRFYPKHELASQVLGYVGMDDKGLAGIELADDEALQGIPGKMLVTMDAKRRWFGRVEKDPEAGESIVLTIDEKIQYIAERELDVAMAQTHAETGTVVVQNPKTGEILALAVRPTFDPNQTLHLDPKALIDRAVSDVYEPGSTFKMVTVAGAVNERVATPNDVVDCQMGSITFNGYRIHDWHPFGMLTVAGILENSSDVGAIKLALRLGDERFYKYIHGFGFGQRTGIELPGESRGLAKPVNRWSKASIGSISMGQEVAVTPIQLVSMTSAMANDGVYTPARIIAGVVPPGGSPNQVHYQVPEQRRVISPMTAAEMHSMLQGVVLIGTAKKAQLNGWTSAGKTGTAQKIDPKTHRYGTKDIASFSGFAPVNNPAISVLVVLDSPVGAHHGGDVGAPVFARVAQQVLQYLNVPTDTEINPKKAIEVAKAKVEAEGDSERLGSLDFNDPSLAEDSNLPTIVKATTLVPAKYVTPHKTSRTEETQDWQPPEEPTQQVASSAPVDAATQVDAGAGIVVDANGRTVPNFAGKPIRSVLSEASADGIDVTVVGSGVADQQSPAAGTPLRGGQAITVWFKR